MGGFEYQTCRSSIRVQVTLEDLHDKVLGQVALKFPVPPNRSFQ